MIKKIIALMLSLLFLFAVGCNGANLHSGNESQTNSSSEKQTQAIAPISGGSATVSPIVGESKVIRLYVGQEGTFENTAYSYRSDDESVLLITGNTYKGLKEGCACVTVEDQIGNVAVYLFTVFGNKPIKLEGLTIQNLPENNSLTVGQSITLSYQKQPANADEYDAIVWASSDSDVLSIDKFGNVKANKMGQAIVSVTALGTNVKRETVINVLPRDTVFAINYNRLVGIVGESEEILVADVLSDYPFQKQIEWFSSDNTVVTVNNGKLSYIKEGEATVGITARINDTDYSATCKVIVKEDEGFTVIRTAEQLQAIANTSGNYMLGNDIDFSKACAVDGALYNGGKGFMPLFEDANNSFKGIFEGNGFAIRNIMINRPNDSFVAFMRYISAEEGNEGVIRNLSVIGGSIKGANYTSVFYANCSGYGNVNSGLQNCYAQLDLHSTGSVSGLVGNNKGIVKNCVSNVTFDALGKICLFALNHTMPGQEYGVMNCVYVGESVTAQMANLSNGGFATNCHAITLEDAKTFNFELLGNGWIYAAGQIPTVKG